MLKISLSVLLKLPVIALGLIGLVYVAACTVLLLRQTRMIFFPSALIENTPTEFNLKHQDVWIPIAAGNRIEQVHGWWIPAAEASDRVVLHLHGNGVNIGANVAQAYRFHQAGLSVLLIDYRGYGMSQGRFPHEEQVYEDTQAAWDYLTQERGFKPEQIFIFGHSLGGAIAINLATQHPDAAGLIVEGSFTSIRSMVDRTKNLSLFPIDLLLTQKFDSINKVRSLQMPVLFIHGEADEVVPADMSKALYDAASEPKQLFLVPVAGHNDVAEVAGRQYLQVISDFVEKAIAVNKIEGRSPSGFPSQN